MNNYLAYLIGGILFIVGLFLAFYHANLGIASIILAVVIAAGQYFLQKKSDQDRHNEYQKLAELIHQGAEANKKIQSLKDLMKQKNISMKKIIEKFDKPLYSIFIYKFNEVPRGIGKNGAKPLTEHMENNLNFRRISNSFYMLLPKDMPEVNSKFDIETWTESNIISRISKKATYTLNFVALVDLRKIFCYKTVEWGNTIFDVLTQDPTFLGKLIGSLSKEKISLKDIIKDYPIGDIITIKVDSSLIKMLNQHSDQILVNLNCKDVTELKDVPSNILKNEILNATGCDAPEIATNIIQNSKVLRDVC